MRRYLSPVLKMELQNLDKDGDIRRSAMKALKLCINDLDSNAIPLFISKVSEAKMGSSSSGECTISLYEVLAHVHGPKIVPYIDIIMSTIITTLTSSAGSIALHQACSKVVPAIARYGIDPTTPEEKKKSIIYSISKPLSNCLLKNQESLSSGSALCLKALVDSDNWRFASCETVNEICQRVVGALEKPTLTNSHIGLVMALAKNNSLIVEAYARLLIQSGVRILNAGAVEGNSQKRLSAIQMINFLLKCLDPKSTISELDFIIQEMENCQLDQMAFVKGAAFETLQTARRIEADPKLSFGGTGSPFSSSQSSPESQIVESIPSYDAFTDSPLSSELNFIRRNVNCKIWKKHENGSSESVCSTEDVPTPVNLELNQKGTFNTKGKANREYKSVTVVICITLFVVLLSALVASFFIIDHEHDGNLNIVPT
ncbi:protein SINE1-like [Impatiens glandulifera]|uniref:protein SINE1-like n=1 Tax=Impatiens glandulifera TaxID=253017 RepID=UPI001FB17C7E|nr:protein SINE1-like [Impatiens glandulifera]